MTNNSRKRWLNQAWTSLRRKSTKQKKSSTVKLRFEELEDRAVPSIAAVTNVIELPAGITSSPSGITPATMLTAYNVPAISPTAPNQQTIAIVDAYNDPNIVSDLNLFDAQYGLAAPPSFTVLNQYGATSPLPTNATTGGWGLEESLDVEWAHAIDPNANIILFEANSNLSTDLYTAINEARTYAATPAISVVSMSFGQFETSGLSILSASESGSTVTITTPNTGNLLPAGLVVGSLVVISGVTGGSNSAGYNGTFAVTAVGVGGNPYSFQYSAVSGLTTPDTGGTAIAESLPESSYDTSYFTTPSGHTGITFVAATGDYGAQYGLQYPAASPNVVSVGGSVLPSSTMAIVSASESGTTVTITTAGLPSSLVVGSSVSIAGVTGGSNTAGYNGTFTVTGVSGDAFTYTASAGLTSPVTGTPLTGTTTNGQPIVTSISSTSGLSVGMYVEGTGIPPNTYIETVNSASEITLTNNATASGTPSLDFLGTTVLPFGTMAIVSASESSTTVTITTGGLPSSLVVGSLVSIGGVTGGSNTAGYNGTFTVTGVSGDSFTYAAPAGLTSPASGTILSGTTTNGTSTVTGFSSTSGLSVGMYVEGTGIPPNTDIESINSSSQITLTNNATASGASSLTFLGTAGASETGWTGSGGGGSFTPEPGYPYESEPGYQTGVQSNGVRTDPDVSMDAGGGVPVYDSYDGAFPIYSATESGGTVTITTDFQSGFMSGSSVVIAGVNGTGTASGYNGTFTITVTSAYSFTYQDPGASGSSTGSGTAMEPWIQVEGTSLATPMFAGVIAIADQLRVANGLPTLDSASQTLPALYNLRAADFHDITTGNNGYSAGLGYDFVTGIGSPNVNLLDNSLATYGALVVTHGTSSASYNLYNDGGAWTFSSVSVLDPLFALETTYGFTLEDAYFNQYGKDEKYLLASNSDWYVLMPNGDIYAWDGDITTTIASVPVATTAQSVYYNPSLLTSNTGTPRATSGTNPLYDLKIELGLLNPASGYNNRGDDEWYLQSTNRSNPAGGGYFVLMPNNMLYAWDGTSLANLQLVANFNSTFYSDAQVYANPALLTGATLPYTTTAVTASVTSAGVLTITPQIGFDRSVQVTVNTSNGPQVYTFSVVDAPPTVPAVSPVSIEHDQTASSFNLNANTIQSQPLSYAPAVGGYSPLYSLEVEYGLTQPPIASDYNVRGENEQYFISTNDSNFANSHDGYYILMPTDKLYAWNGVSLASTIAQTPVADFTAAPYSTILDGGSVYNNPALLDEAPFPAVPTVAENQGLLYNIKEEFGLNTAGLGMNNRGMDEVYFISSNGSNYAGANYYVLFPDGYLYPFVPDGTSLSATLAQPPVADLAAEGVYANNSLLYNAQPTTINDPVYNVKEMYGLTEADIASDYNVRGQSEKYFISTNGSNAANGGYYILMPSDKLYAWNGVSLASTILQTPVADFTTAPYSTFLGSGNVYNTTLLLYADSGHIAAVAATIDSSGNVTITQNSGYVGAATVTANVSDGAEYTNQSFQVTVTDGAPVLMASVPSIIISSATESGNTVTVTTTSSHGLSVGQAVAISGVSVANYDGVFTITATTATTFTYTDSQSGLGSATGGTVTPLTSISSATESGSTATITTSSTSIFSVGEQVLVTGVSIAGYDGDVTVSGVTSTTITYTASVSGLASATGGVVTPLVGPVSVSSSAGSVAIALNVIDPENDALQYSASIAVNPLYSIQQEFGLTQSDITADYNVRHEGEKYFISQNGSNFQNGDDGYYILMPNDMLYAWDGVSLAATLATTPVADFAPYANVYGTTSLLYAATSSSVTNVSYTITNTGSGGTLNISWASGYTGTFLVTAIVGDGVYDTQQQFLVTVH